MNEAEAREITGRGKTFVFQEWSYARGYLEAIEKAKGLVEVIKRRIGSHDHECSAHTPEKEALAKWEAEK